MLHWGVSALISEIDTNVMPDWNQNDPDAGDYVKNRPGGYTVTTPEMNIQWDGEIGVRANVNMGEDRIGITTFYVKVSDVVLEKDNLVGASMTSISFGEITEFTLEEDYITVGEGFVKVIDNLIISVQAAGEYDFGNEDKPQIITIPESGTYFIKEVIEEYATYVKSLKTMASTEIVKIPQKYIEGLTDISELTKNVMVNGDESIILKSPTKKFKITVDDSGTILATEVTS